MDGPSARAAARHPQPDRAKRRRIDVNEYARMAAAVIPHREPGEDGYGVMREAARDEVPEPALLPGPRLAVADLLA
jgi:hypothetical protein